MYKDLEPRVRHGSNEIIMDECHVLRLVELYQINVVYQSAYRRDFI